MNNPPNPPTKPPFVAFVVLAVGALLLALSIGTFPSEDHSAMDFIKHLLPAVAGLICIHHGIKGAIRISD